MALTIMPSHWTSVTSSECESYQRLRILTVKIFWLAHSNWVSITSFGSCIALHYIGPLLCILGCNNIDEMWEECCSMCAA